MFGVAHLLYFESVNRKLKEKFCPRCGVNSSANCLDAITKQKKMLNGRLVPSGWSRFLGDGIYVSLQVLQSFDWYTEQSDMAYFN